MTSHLPHLPPKKENLNGQLLVDPNTSAALCWSLLHEVDPHSTIDGKSLLQVFCENRERGQKIIRAPLDFHEHPLPLGPGQPWPKPSANQKFGDAEMWIAAHLICNGPDPFEWTTKSGKGIMDYAVEWQNSMLMDQLLRIPHGPAIRSLEKKSYFNHDYGWLHGLAKQKGTAAVLDAMLTHGWVVDLKDKKGMTALHHAVDGDQASILIAAGADPLAVDKEGNTVRDAWIKQAKALSTYSTQNFPILDTDSKLKILDDACLSRDREQVMKQVVPSIFDITSKSKNMHFAKEASKTYEVALQDWILKENGNQWSLVGYMAMEALKKQKSSAVNCILSLLEELPPESMSHVSTKNLPDLSLAWLACRHYGDNLDDCERKTGRLIEVIAPFEGTTTKSEAWVKVLNAAMELDGSQTFKGKKISEHIELAWKREISSLQKRLNTYLTVKSGETPVQVEVLLADPEILIRMASMPFNDTNTTQSLCGTLIHLGRKHPEQAGIYLQVAANLAINPLQKGEWAQKHIKDLFEAMMDLTPEWNSSLEGSEKRWLGLCALASGDKKWGDMMSKMQANRLESTTDAATYKRNAPRL